MNESEDREPRRRHHHDTHAIPPQAICDVFQRYLRMRNSEVLEDDSIIDFQGGLSAVQKQDIQPAYTVAKDRIRTACQKFLDAGSRGEDEDEITVDDTQDCVVYEHARFPGLRIFPSLLPPSAQLALVSRLLHRDLANPLHKTNLHDTHCIPYPLLDEVASEAGPDQIAKSEVVAKMNSMPSFFTFTGSDKDEKLTPKAADGDHQSMNVAQFLRRRLRWMTLGAQYDWPLRSYPAQDAVASPFPRDIKTLVSSLFPRVRAESGVVLIYSAKGYMPVHRDVSEECERELCSFSLGCDGLFLLALPLQEEENRAAQSDGGVGDATALIKERDFSDPAMKIVALRIRSGDMLQLDGRARWAWHAMPKVIPGTCPEWLSDWPVRNSRTDHKNYSLWKGYMTGKRVNLSCRQVWDE